MLAYMSLIDSPNDRVNFELVYQTYRNLMFFIAYKILNNPQDAEDAVHTAFIKIAENMSKIEVAVCPKTKAFVVTIVENTAIDLYRKKKRSDNIDFLENFPESPIDLEHRSVLAQCMAKLPTRYREIILLKYSYGIPVETAELVYAFNSEAETYQPCWRFTIEGYAAVLVNCFSGSIYEM